MKILITGATGFIGKNLVKELVRKKHNIRCLVRKESNRRDIKFLKDLKADIVYGDICNKKSLSNAVEGTAAVIHLAGILGGFNVNKEDYYSVNVEGTQNILDKCTTQKFIYCSTAGVFGPIMNCKEADSPKPSDMYEKTKFLAEKYVREYQNYVIIRPTFVYGPYDMHSLKMFSFIKKFRIVPKISKTSKIQPIYVKDVVDILVKAVEKDLDSRIYNIAGTEEIAVSQLFYKISEELGIKIMNFYIPIFLAKLYVNITEPFSKLLKIDTVLTRSRFLFYTKSRTFNINKAAEELDFNPINISEGLERTIQWYKRNNFL